MAEGHWCTSRSPDVSLRGAKRRGNLAVPGRIVGKLSAKTQLPSRDCHVGLWPPRNDKLGSLTHSPEISPDLQLPKAVTDRRYRRNWCIPFSRRPVRIGSIAPGGDSPAPTMACTIAESTRKFAAAKGGHYPPLQTQLVHTVFTAAGTNRQHCAGRGQPGPYNGVYNRREYPEICSCQRRSLPARGTPHP